MTLGEELIEEGRQQGLQEGRQEGMQQSLLRLLSMKFGAPSADVLDRVRAAEPEQLEAWIARVLFAESSSAVFGD
jgi:predicted transposase YdaD